MAKKHLHELLTEAQEPFLLSNYIAGRRSQVKKHNSLAKNTKTASKSTLCNKSCFFSYTESPNCANSPFPGIPSPVKNNAHLKTVSFDLSLLLEAAEKIKTKCQNRKVGNGVFRSIIRKFQKSVAKCEKVENFGNFAKNEDPDTGFGRSSCSSGSGENCLNEKRICPSPVSTCLISLQTSPAVFLQSPEYLSPSTSPCHGDIQGNDVVECKSKQSQEEDKDQFSPVSILEPPFEDDTEQNESEEDEDNYDMECSYAAVQRAKEQLLERLLRFEKLAGLDPIELERSILETKSDDDEDDNDADDDDELEEYTNDTKNLKISMNKHWLVSDIIAKDKRKGDGTNEGKISAKRLCRKVGFWEKLEFKTKIDTMVEVDLRSDNDHGWNEKEHLEETVVEIELSVFGLLVKELADDLFRKHV